MYVPLLIISWKRLNDSSFKLKLLPEIFDKIICQFVHILLSADFLSLLPFFSKSFKLEETFGRWSIWSFYSKTSFRGFWSLFFSSYLIDGLLGCDNGYISCSKVRQEGKSLTWCSLALKHEIFMGKLSKGKNSTS